jgi:hypothetical protein
VLHLHPRTRVLGSKIPATMPRPMALTSSGSSSTANRPAATGCLISVSSSSASAYRTHRYSHPFFSIPVMSPTVRSVAFGLAANLKAISQSSVPRCEPDAPRNSTSPRANPLNGAWLTRPVR